MKSILLLSLLFSACLAAIDQSCKPTLVQSQEASWKNGNEGIFSQWKGTIYAPASSGISSLSYRVSDGSFYQVWELVFDSGVYVLPQWRQNSGGIAQSQSHSFGYITRQNSSVTFTIESLVCSRSTSPSTSPSVSASAAPSPSPSATVAPKVYPLTILCADPAAEGPCREVQSTEGVNACYNVPAIVNDAISSLQVFADFEATPRAVGLTLFADPDCSGYSENVESYYVSQLPASIDNKASSFKFLTK
eukprot:TRINITY_DN653_c0_g1_i1.p1 TRINITY_DN653_c0_g1~~TRINITY_DN653_c0_g1_i1.p1  ORF type:complete len:248 (+),score=55.72 TRINITY_DN653_c0_g1_i1:242-985(+)